MRLLLRLFVAIMVIFQSLFAAGCRGVVNRMAFYPQTIDMTTQAPAADGLEEVFFESTDGTRLQALFIARPGASRAALFLHGNAGHVYHRVSDAVALADAGVNVLLLSYRGYGKSAGQPSEAGVYADAEAALAHLREQRGFATGDIFIYGRSLGSAVAIHVARDRELAGLILVAPLTSAKAVAKGSMGPLASLAGDALNSVGKVGDLESRTLFIHGDRDRIIPIQLGRDLYAAVPRMDKSFVTVPGAGHNDLVQVAGSSYWIWIREFIEAG